MSDDLKTIVSYGWIFGLAVAVFYYVVSRLRDAVKDVADNIERMGRTLDDRLSEIDSRLVDIESAIRESAESSAPEQN
jgi:predicted PurR-regulated permease PerM